MARFPLRLPPRIGLLGAAAVLVIGLVAPQAWGWSKLRSARAALAGYHPDEARAALAACERVWPGRASVRLLASRAARQDGDLEAAQRELRAAQRLAGGATQETAFEWALLQAAGGNVWEVEVYLQERAGRDPDTAPLVWEALAAGYLRAYRSPDAMVCLNHWLRIDPNNVRALELRGETYVTGKGVVRGSEDYRRVLELDPTRKETRWRLINCLIALGTYDEAIKHLRVVAQERPDDPEVLARLARCHYLRGDVEEARRIIDDALAKHPDNGTCVRTRGQFALTDPKDPRKTDAVHFLRRAAELMPENYQTQFLFATALQQNGKEAEARAQFAVAEAVKERRERLSELTSRRLADNPLDPSLHYETGMLLIRGGQPDVGERWLISALALDPDHRPSHAALADLYTARGDKAKAEEHRRRATGELPGSE